MGGLRQKGDPGRTWLWKLIAIPTVTMIGLMVAHLALDQVLDKYPSIHNSTTYQLFRMSVMSLTMSGVIGYLVFRYRRDHERSLKRKSEDLEAVRDDLARIIDSSGEGIISVDDEGSILSWNRSADHIYGWTAEEMIGKNVDRLLPDEPEYRKELDRLTEAVRAGGVLRHYETMRRTKDGRSITVHITVSPMHSADGRYEGRTIFVHDATRLVELQAQLVNQERLAALGQMSAAVAHEIKNPLAGMRGACEILVDGYEEGDARIELGREMLRQVARLDRSVQDLLAFARPPAVKPVPSDIHLIIQRVLRLISEDPLAEGIAVHRSYSQELPALDVDPQLMEQVLFNILINAFQSLDNSGCVSIVTEPDGDHALIRVRDDGPGIPGEIVSRVFEPFFTTRTRGTGLGLSIVRSIVETHGGAVSVKTRFDHGRGTEFVISLPMEP